LWRLRRRAGWFVLIFVVACQAPDARPIGRAGRLRHERRASRSAPSSDSSKVGDLAPAEAPTSWLPCRAGNEIRLANGTQGFVSKVKTDLVVGRGARSVLRRQRRGRGSPSWPTSDTTII